MILDQSHVIFLHTKFALKILSSRLKIELPELISENQLASIKGRLLRDNFMLATEILK